MSLTLRALGAVIAIMLTASACSTEDDGEPEAAGTGSSTPNTPTPSTTGAAETECTVPGYVATDAKEVTGGRAVAVYAAGRHLPPDGIWEGTEILVRFDRAPVEVTSTSGPVPADIRRSVLDSVGVAWGKNGPPEESGPHPFSLHNDTSQNRTYVIYRGAELLSGTWSAERCGAPYNDGTEIVRMTGEFTTLTPIRSAQVHPCGDDPSDKYERAAMRFCRQRHALGSRRNSSRLGNGETQ
ncbi:MAG: hypothetical protein Q8O61_00020 [Nocardioides sp.]|nr:hypothetical protein [Nocardioides sp.]